MGVGCVRMMGDSSPWVIEGVVVACVASGGEGGWVGGGVATEADITLIVPPQRPPPPPPPHASATATATAVADGDATTTHAAAADAAAAEAARQQQLAARRLPAYLRSVLKSARPDAVVVDQACGGATPCRYLRVRAVFERSLRVGVGAGAGSGVGAGVDAGAGAGVGDGGASFPDGAGEPVVRRSPRHMRDLILCLGHAGAARSMCYFLRRWLGDISGVPPASCTADHLTTAAAAATGTATTGRSAGGGGGEAGGSAGAGAGAGACGDEALARYAEEAVWASSVQGEQQANLLVWVGWARSFLCDLPPRHQVAQAMRVYSHTSYSALGLDAGAGYGASTWEPPCVASPLPGVVWERLVMTGMVVASGSGVAPSTLFNNRGTGRRCECAVRAPKLSPQAENFLFRVAGV